MKVRKMLFAASASLVLEAQLAPAYADADSQQLVAAPIAEKTVLSGKEKLDPAAGYIFVNSPTRQFGTFLRQPDAEGRAAWEKDRQAAFVKEHKRWVGAMAHWPGNVEIAKHNHAEIPEQPIEPKIETFVHEPLELRDTVQFGARLYSKGTTFTYLEKVKPGIYIWYGQVMGGNGFPAAGVCMCMGSIAFEVKPGVVTDLGNSLLVLPQWNENPTVQQFEAKQALEKRAAQGKEAISYEFGPLAYGLPDSLKDWPSVKAEFHASPKMNNYFGVFVSRLAPIPGVLAYRRDTVVDARTGQDVASPTLVSRQKPKL